MRYTEIMLGYKQHVLKKIELNNVSKSSVYDQIPVKIESNPPQINVGFRHQHVSNVIVTIFPH